MAQNVATITKDERSPFSGYVVKEQTFRSMLFDIKEKNLTKSELQICLEANRTEEMLTKPEWFMIGIIGGLVAGSGLVYLSR